MEDRRTLHTHTQMKCLDRGESHRVTGFFLNTGSWGGAFFFPAIKKKKGKKAQKCMM